MTMPEQLIKAIIADGDEESGTLLKQMVQSCCADIEIISMCGSLTSISNSLKEYNPGIIFTETEFPDGNIFDLLKNIPKRNFKLIFVTSSHDYAIQAFRYSVSDYLIKPVLKEELIDAIRKVKAELADAYSFEGLRKYFETLNKNNEVVKTLTVANSKGFIVLKTDDIIFLEADGYCTNFYLPGKTKISSARNLKYYSSLLPSSTFMRVHHSFIINLNHVKAFNSNEEILLSENLSCSLSAANKNLFLNYFKHKK